MLHTKTKWIYICHWTGDLEAFASIKEHLKEQFPDVSEVALEDGNIYITITITTPSP